MASAASPRDAAIDPAPSGAGSLFLRALLLAALATPAAAAAPLRTLEVGAGLVRFDYVERTDSGSVLDRERGWVPTLHLRAAAEADRLFAAVDGRLGAGGVRYEGQTQSSNPALDALPVTTTTEATFVRVEARGGAWLDAGRRVALHAGAAARWWERDIRPTTVTARTGAPVPVAGLFEEYTWQELSAGLRLAVEAGVRARVELDARYVQVVHPRIAVDWSGRRVELPLGLRPGWRVGLDCRIDLPAGWLLVVAGEAEGYGFGKSEPDPVAMILEPESRTLGLAIGARLGHRF